MAKRTKSPARKQANASRAAGSRGGKKGLRLSRTCVRVIETFEEADRLDQEYWRRQTPYARLRELERLRQLNYGYGGDKPTPRIEKLMRVRPLKAQ